MLTGKLYMKIEIPLQGWVMQCDAVLIRGNCYVIESLRVSNIRG